MIQFYLGFFVIIIVVMEYCGLILQFLPRPVTTILEDFSQFNFLITATNYCFSVIYTNARDPHDHLEATQWVVLC